MSPDLRDEPLERYLQLLAGSDPGCCCATAARAGATR